MDHSINTDWVERLDAFLQFNEREIQADRGKADKLVADRLGRDGHDGFPVRRLSGQAQEDVVIDSAERALIACARPAPSC